MAVDHNRLFKKLITTFFEEFLLLFFPHVHEHIDFQHVSFLSEELFTDVTAGEKYRVDLLVETKLKGEDSLIIVHIENQSYVQPSFPERMFGCVPVTPRRLSKFDRDRESLDGSLFFHFRSRNVVFTVENTQQNRKRGAYMAVDHDRLFKELITTFFEEFLLLFFPHVHEHIDFQHVSFLSEELFTDVTVGEKYRVDLLVETKLKGGDSLIIVHIENQSYVQPSFPERMFIYFIRLFEKYRKRMLPIAVFSHDYLRNEPSSFTLQFPFFDVLHFRFLTVELRKQNWRDYIRHDNPIAAALLSKMGYTESERVELKKQFLRMIVRMELDEAKQRLLIGFFETYVKLSDEEEQQLRNEVNEMETKEKEKVLELLISYEQKGIQKGIQKGKKEGLEEGFKQGMKHLVRNMSKKGMTPKEIATLVDLTEEEVNHLLES